VIELTAEQAQAVAPGGSRRDDSPQDARGVCADQQGTLRGDAQMDRPIEASLDNPADEDLIEKS
jgi:hypothetical protein